VNPTSRKELVAEPAPSAESQHRSVLDSLRNSIIISTTSTFFAVLF